MLRLTLKLSSKNFLKGSPYGPVRVVTLSRYLASQQNPNQCVPPPVVPPTKKSSFKTKFYLSLTGLALAVGGVIYYAKQDDDFREFLEEQVPGTDNFIKRLTAEDQSYYDQTTDLLSEIRDFIWSMFAGTPTTQKTVIYKKKGSKEEDYQPPAPAFEPVVSKLHEPITKFTEIRIQKDPCVPPETVSGKPIKTPLPISHPKSILEVEQRMGEAAKEAIKSFSAASDAYSNYMRTVFDFVDQSIEKIDTKQWEELKKLSQAKKETAEGAASAAESAASLLSQLEEALSLIDEVDPVVMKTARANIDVLKEDVNEAKKALERDRARASVTERYWMKVADARKHFSEELTILFPDIDLESKRMKVAESDLDLFILHAYQQILLLQKQLLTIENCTYDKLGKAIQKTGDDKVRELIDTKVELKLEDEKKKLHQNYQKKLLEMKSVSERDLRNMMRSQDQAHGEEMKKAVASKEKEILQRLNHDFEDRLSIERTKYKTELASLVGRLKGMDDAIKAKAAAEREAQHAQSLWSACQALYRQLRATRPGEPPEKQLHPLANEITLVSNSAADGDEFVDVVLKAIPKEAATRGVYPEPALRERFLKVETQARKLAFVPETGASLFRYMLSYFGCWLMNMAADPIPDCEINDNPIDVSKLTTFDILKRARYWMDRGDIDRALRYMNLLQAASRIVACEWMKEARIYLETVQATDALLAHASASSLRYL